MRKRSSLGVILGSEAGELSRREAQSDVISFDVEALVDPAVGIPYECRTVTIVRPYPLAVIAPHGSYIEEQFPDPNDPPDMYDPSTWYDLPPMPAAASNWVMAGDSIGYEVPPV